MQCDDIINPHNLAGHQAPCGYCHGLNQWQCDLGGGGRGERGGKPVFLIFVIASYTHTEVGVDEEALKRERGCITAISHL